MRVTKRLPSLSNVAAGSTSVLNLPLGRTYENIKLVYAGVTLAQLKNIQLKANGKVFQRFADGNEIDLINKYYGRPAADGILTMWFVQPEMKTARDERITALGTADLKTLTLEFDIDAGAANPVITAHAIQSEAAPFGLCTKVLRFPVNSAVTGVQEIDNLPTAGARIKAIHLLKSDVSAVELEINGFLAYEASKALSEQNQKDYARVPQTASATHLDFVLEGDMAQAVVTQGVQDMRLRQTLETAGATNILVEYYDGLAGI